MIEDPYRWVEAIANRREYIEHQLAGGSPIVCISCAAGVLLLTLSRERQKIFEIYDRVAMGAIGHPGDIERLRMAAIEGTSAEGFTRSPLDVSLRRLVSYNLSPTLKNAFEQIYGPPFLIQMLFAEVGRPGEPDLLMRLDYDGAFHTNGGTFHKGVQPFAVISGRPHSAALMERFLQKHAATFAEMSQEEAEAIALDAWVVGMLAMQNQQMEELPTAEAITAEREAQLARATVEAALLDRCTTSSIAYRPLHVELVEKKGRPAALV